MQNKYPSGVYLNIPAENYHADKSVSSSGLKDLSLSPFKWWYNSPFNPNRPEERSTTTAMKFGTAYHTLMLEPYKFNYGVVKGQKSTTKDNYLGEGEMQILKDMQAEFNREPVRQALLQEGYPEVSVFWMDEATGIPCRIRMDYWNAHFITDLKTVTSVDDATLANVIPAYGYDLSAGMYVEGFNALRKMIKAGNAHIDEGISQAFIKDFVEGGDNFILAFQEKEAPYECRCLVLNNYLKTYGINKFHSGLAKLQKLFEENGTGNWRSQYPALEDLTDDMLNQWKLENTNNFTID